MPSPTPVDGVGAERPTTARREPMTPRPATAGGAGTAPAARRHPSRRRSTTPSGSTAASRPCPTRAARGSRTACTGRAAPSTRARYAWARRRLARTRAGRRRARRGRLRAARRHLHPRGHPRRRRRPGSTTSSTSASTSSSSCRSPPSPGRWGWGYDGVDLYAVHDGLRRPGRAPALRRRVPRARPRRLPRRRLQPPRAQRATTSREFGPYFTDAHHTPWGPAVNLDDDGQPTRCGAGSIDNALRWFRDFHVDALRLDAVHELRDDSRAARARRSCPTRSPRSPTRSAARSTSSPRATSTTPSWSTPTGRGRPGHDGAVGRRRPPRPARRADRRDAGLLRRLRRRHRGVPEGGPLAVLAKTLTDGVPPRRHAVDLPRPAVGRAGRPRGAVGRAVPRLPADPRPGRQPRRRRPHQRPALARAAGHRRRALPASSPFTPMVFMGEEWARHRRRGSSSPTSRTPELADAVRRGPAGRVRRARLGRATTCPTRRTPRPATRSVLDWAEADARPTTRGCCSGTPPAPACAATSLGDGPTRFADVDGQPTTRTPGGWS